MYTCICLLFGREAKEINQIVFKNAKKYFQPSNQKKDFMEYRKKCCSFINYGLKLCLRESCTGKRGSILPY